MTQFTGDSLDEYTDLYERYGGYVTARYENDRSAARRKRGAKRWLQFCADNDVDPYAATGTDAENYIESVLELADTSVGSLYDSLTMFYEWAMRKPEFDIPENPTAEIDLEQDFGIKQTAAEYIKHLDGDRDDVKALPKVRVERLFGHGGNPEIRNELILRLLWETAIRSSELATARIADVNLASNELEVDSAKLNPRDHPDLNRRKVFYSDETARLLRMWRDHARHDLSPYAGDSEYLLLTHQSKKMRPSHISRIVKEAAKDAGEQEPMYEDQNGNTRWLITAHRLRHSRISYLANKEDAMNLPSLRRLAGHAKIETTMSYIHTDWDTVRREYMKATR